MRPGSGVRHPMERHHFIYHPLTGRQVEGDIWAGMGSCAPLVTAIDALSSRTIYLPIPSVPTICTPSSRCTLAGRSADDWHNTGKMSKMYSPRSLYCMYKKITNARRHMATMRTSATLPARPAALDLISINTEARRPPATPVQPTKPHRPQLARPDDPDGDHRLERWQFDLHEQRQPATGRALSIRTSFPVTMGLLITKELDEEKRALLPLVKMDGCRFLRLVQPTLSLPLIRPAGR